jgi:hypothetical protein
MERYIFQTCTALTHVTCNTTKAIFNATSNVLSGSAVTTITAPTGLDWTAGSGQTIGGQSGITVTLV